MTKEEAVAFINSMPWTFAKTYAKTAPHEYILRFKPPIEMLDYEKKFDELVAFMKENSVLRFFYGRPFKYFILDGKKYWAMRCKDDSETLDIINRDDAARKFI